MSDEVPSGRLSQIFDPLTNLQQQPSTHYQQQLAINRRRSNSSSPSTSGRVTPASVGAASNGSGASSSTSSHLQQQQQHHQFCQQQQNYQYLTQTHNYFHVRSQDGEVGAGAHNYLHTFPSTHTPSHLQQHQFMQQQYHQYHQQQLPQHMMPSSTYLQHSQQQQHSLPPLYGTSQSLSASPLMTKRAISFSGQIPLNRQQMENLNVTGGHKQHPQALQAAQSTPNSPRLMPRRQTKPPPIPAKPSSIPSTSSTTSSSSNKSTNQKDSVGTSLNPASSLDGADAPWPHFSSLTDYLDVHQVNNYAQPVPEINWQERCLELQLELHRSKNQAGRIRDMLREKVSGMSFFLYYLLLILRKHNFSITLN